MANEIITTLHPDNNPDVNLYPNIKGDNIPSKSINRDKLIDSINNLLNSINELKPSGTDTSANILNFTSNKGIYVATDNGHWYYWGGTQYVDGGVYQAVSINDGSIDLLKLESYFKNTILNLSNFVNLEGTIKYGYFISKYSHQEEAYANTKYITCDVSSVKYLAVTTYVGGNMSASFYDNNDNYISGSMLALSSGQNTDFLVIVPNNAKYIKVSCRDGQSDPFYVKYINLFNKVDTDQIALNVIDNYLKYIRQDLVFETGFVTWNGTIDTQFTWYKNTKVLCKYLDKFKYSTDARGEGVFAITYYDENDNFIAQEGRNVGIVSDVEITINYPNCAYFRMSSRDTENSSVYKYDLDYTNTNADTITPEVVLNSGIKNATNKKLGYLDTGKVIITIDDGGENDPIYVFPLIETYNIPIVFACWSSSFIILNYLSDLLNYISNYRCEIAQHTYEPYNNKTIIESYKYLKNQKTLFNTMGIDIKNFVYGYNAYDDNLVFVASSLYDVACSGGNKINTPSSKNYILNRVWITGKTLNEFKDLIDNAKDNKNVLIIGAHSTDLTDNATYQKLKDLIEYCQTNDVEITTLSGIND